MSVNIMDLVKGAVSNQVMGQIGGLLGTDAKKTPSLFETAAGSILGGLMKKGSTRKEHRTFSAQSRSRTIQFWTSSAICLAAAMPRINFKSREAASSTWSRGARNSRPA